MWGWTGQDGDIAAIKLQQMCDGFFMHNVFDKLIKYSQKAYQNKEVPVAAFLLNSDNKIAFKGMNCKQSKNDVLGHAEIICIKKASKKLKTWNLSGHTLITTLKPCELCMSAIGASQIKKVIYLYDKNSKNNNLIELIAKNYKIDLFLWNQTNLNFNIIRKFFKDLRNEQIL